MIIIATSRFFYQGYIIRALARVVPAISLPIEKILLNLAPTVSNFLLAKIIK